MLAGPALADDTHPAADAPAGLQAAIDPDTGKLRALTPAEAAALAAELRSRYLGPEADDQPAVYNPDGSVTKVLGTRREMFTMARIEADGSLTTVCVNGVDEAVAFVEASAVGTAADTTDGEDR